MFRKMRGRIEITFRKLVMLFCTLYCLNAIPSLSLWLPMRDLCWLYAVHSIQAAVRSVSEIRGNLLPLAANAQESRLHNAVSVFDSPSSWSAFVSWNYALLLFAFTRKLLNTSCTIFRYKKTINDFWGWLWNGFPVHIRLREKKLRTSFLNNKGFVGITWPFLYLDFECCMQSN